MLWAGFGLPCYHQIVLMEQKAQETKWVPQCCDQRAGRLATGTVPSPPVMLPRARSLSVSCGSRGQQGPWWHSTCVVTATACEGQHLAFEGVVMVALRSWFYSLLLLYPQDIHFEYLWQLAEMVQSSIWHLSRWTDMGLWYINNLHFQRQDYINITF